MKLSFAGNAKANFDQWDVAPDGATRGAILFSNADGLESFYLDVNGNPSSYNETLTASLGAGNEGSRIALRTIFHMTEVMGTNYVYEWKQVGSSTPLTVESPKETPADTAAAKPEPPPPSPTPKYSKTTYPPPDDPEWEEFAKQTEIVVFGDLYGEVLVKRYGEDDDAYIFAELDTPLYHGMVIKTAPRSGAILSFSDMSTFIMKEDSIIVLDIKHENKSKLALIAGDVWANLKRMAIDGGLEIEMSQVVAGIKGTTLICSEKDGVSTVKVLEGTVEVTLHSNIFV